LTILPVLDLKAKQATSRAYDGQDADKQTKDGQEAMRTTQIFDKRSNVRYGLKGEKVKIWLRLARFLIRQLIDCSTYQLVNFSTH
jgi:hypothetical protein